ncbi:acetolactate synthase small subunit [Salinigranum rubrum]|uniref:Acetolactate synthase small subunit n=1 Tax=Salinigranum rubrum TaxID=755307 RepID=A0A2I8VIQ8_9EURY|nr:acetolactate synthase small subunit [Salinigranum rubrum]AUV81800.1 acetolactate synthase small subunit [Salinigranum rubrum]
MSSEHTPENQASRAEDTHRRGLKGPSPEERPHPEGRRNSQGIRIDPEVEAEPEVREAVLSALVLNEPGVLARASGLFARRQFNIESLTVGTTQNEEYSRITLVVKEPEPGIEQAKKQLEKLVPVISVTELTEDAVRRELALIKVDGDHPDQIAAVADMYDGTVVDASAEAITVEVTGTNKTIENALDTFERFGVREIVRTGTAALEAGANATAKHWPDD